MRRLVVVVLALLSMAPTAGDVGGCGKEATLLDVNAFARARKEEDCARCGDCGLDTARCKSACDPKAAPLTAIPVTCRPLLHDGEVCLRALGAASCADYTNYVSESPSLPGECKFCRGDDTATSEGSFGDGGNL